MKDNTDKVTNIYRPEGIRYIIEISCDIKINMTGIWLNLNNTHF